VWQTQHRGQSLVDGFSLPACSAEDTILMKSVVVDHPPQRRVPFQSQANPRFALMRLPC
jgi:hypothetical protein